MTSIEFLRSWDLPGVTESAMFDMYRSHDLTGMGLNLATHAEHYISLFSESVYEDYFAVVDWPILTESLDELELVILRSALPPFCRMQAFDEIGSFCMLDGLRAVMRHRFHSADRAEIACGVDMFNLIMESALNSVVGENPFSVVRLLSPTEAAASWWGTFWMLLIPIQVFAGLRPWNRPSASDFFP